MLYFLKYAINHNIEPNKLLTKIKFLLFFTIGKSSEIAKVIVKPIVNIMRLIIKKFEEAIFFLSK